MAKTTEINIVPTAVTFADNAFKSRMIVLEDGRSFAVENKRIVSTDNVLTAYLDQHPEFQRIEEQ